MSYANKHTDANARGLAIDPTPGSRPPVRRRRPSTAFRPPRESAEPRRRRALGPFPPLIRTCSPATLQKCTGHTHQLVERYRPITESVFFLILNVPKASTIDNRSGLDVTFVQTVCDDRGRREGRVRFPRLFLSSDRDPHFVHDYLRAYGSSERRIL